MTDVLSRRALNRALLARQALLAREPPPAPALGMVERLAGIQAQNPHSGHLALWARIEDFDPSELDGLLERGEVVRLALMRSTVHLVSAADALAWRPLHDAVLDRSVRAAFHRDLEGLDPEQLAADARELTAQEPLLPIELGRRLAEHHP